MNRLNSPTTWALVFVLLLAAAGCGDPDKKAGTSGLSGPSVISVAPPDSSAGVCPSTVVSATFSEAMNSATITPTSFTLTGPNSATITGTVSYDAASKTAIFKPGINLALATSYTATITTAVQDAYGNAMAANYTWKFTTGIAACSTLGAPAVVSVTPANGACPNTTVSATFSEAMNPATINGTTFTLSGTGSAGTVAYNVPALTAVYTPTVPLALNSPYTATITTGAQDLLGKGLAGNYTFTFTTAASACQAPIPLGLAASFKVLAGSTVTNTGPTTITGGDLGLSPGTAVTGFPPGTMVPPAVMHITDPIAAQAQLDLTAAYNYAAGLPSGAVLPGDMAGLTFTPGVYKTSSTVQLSVGNVTLDAQGNANAVFVFQVGSTLTTLGSTQVILAGGAQAKNVFWQVGSSATLGTNSTFKGTIMALQAITLQTGASLQGRALARNAAVTMDSSTIN